MVGDSPVIWFQASFSPKSNASNRIPVAVSCLGFRGGLLLAYARATPCPVLTWRMVIPALVAYLQANQGHDGTGLRVCCAMCGTDTAYGTIVLRARC
eukprot:1884105-Rhodomonas_salina.2